jgi:DNA-binding transcriptional LysR family regulator
VAVPTAESKVRVGATASTLMIARTLTDRTLTRATPFEIVRLTSNSALLAEAAQEKIQVGLTLALPENSILWATPLGEESLVLIAHPSQTTLNLTLAQVLDIYEGRNNNWVAATREDGDDSRSVFDAKALRGVKPSLNTALAPSPEAMLKFIASNPKGLGYVPASWLNDSVKTISLESKPYTDPNYFLRVLVVAVAKQEPSGRTREWLSEAQSIRH